MRAAQDSGKVADCGWWTVAEESNYFSPAHRATKQQGKGPGAAAAPSLKIRWPQGRDGSTPFSGTKSILVRPC